MDKLQNLRHRVLALLLALIFSVTVPHGIVGVHTARALNIGVEEVSAENSDETALDPDDESANETDNPTITPDDDPQGEENEEIPESALSEDSEPELTPISPTMSYSSVITEDDSDNILTGTNGDDFINGFAGNDTYTAATELIR
jgi:hypothetical protein